MPHSFPTRRSSDRLSIISDNPHNLNITPIENAQQVPALQDVDYATIQGNFIIAGGLDYDDALAVEDQPVEFSNVVTVRSEEHTSELTSLMRISYAVFGLQKKNNKKQCVQ